MERYKIPGVHGRCIQYGLWPNCSNNCSFCLIKENDFMSNEECIAEIRKARENIKLQDWEDTFSGGISILGGEIYFTQDKKIQEEYLLLIDDIIEEVLKVAPNSRYSTVTNGIYDPEFLFKVCDRISEKVGTNRIDMNFSFDLKYRFRDAPTWQESKKARQCLDNINAFHNRYNYILGIQMILTQYVIDQQFSPTQFIDTYAPGNRIAFLYPHPIYRGEQQWKDDKNAEPKDFNFTRNSFLKYLKFIEEDAPLTFRGFCESVKNSSKFKFTGLYAKGETGDGKQVPFLADGKEIFNPDCGHSILYSCYAPDSNGNDDYHCLLCDLVNLGYVTDYN